MSRSMMAAQPAGAAMTLGGHLIQACVSIAGPTAERRYRAATPAELEMLWREQWRIDLSHAREHIAACDADPLLLVLEVELLVREHWTAIERVAAALEERGTLIGAEIDALMHPMSAAGGS
jgi:hypothetical protein